MLCNKTVNLLNMTIVRFEVRGYHITVCALNRNFKNQDKPQLLRELQNLCIKYNNRRFDIEFIEMWGNNSVLTKASYFSEDDGQNYDLDDIRQKIVAYIDNKYPNTVDRTRYSTGLPPQHIDIKGNQALAAYNFGIDTLITHTATGTLVLELWN